LNYLLGLVTSLLLTLSFPRYDFTWLMPVALTPLLWAAAREPRPLRRFLIGWLAGAGVLFGVTDWIRFVVSVHGGLGDVGGWAVFLLFCAAKGFYFGVFALLAGPVLRLAWAVPAVAALWVGVDLTFGSLGFQWVTLGNAASDMSIPMRLAPYTGVHGLSFAFMMMSTALLLVILRRPRWQIAPLLLLPALILLPPLPGPEPGEARAIVLQPNIDEVQEWTRQSLERTERELALLTMRAALRAGSAKPDLLIWPELPAPFYYYDDADFRQLASGLATVTRTGFLLGTVAHSPRGAPLNSALLLSAAGEPLARYDKIHLVPFGEYVPWPFGFFNKITKEVGDFEPGAGIVVAPLADTGSARSSAMNRPSPGWFADSCKTARRPCSTFRTMAISDAARRRASSILLVVRMRAAENARWIVRATNDGITAAVDPAGRVVSACRRLSKQPRPAVFLPQRTDLLHTPWRLVRLELRRGSSSCDGPSAEVMIEANASPQTISRSSPGPRRRVVACRGEIGNPFSRSRHRCGSLTAKGGQTAVFAGGCFWCTEAVFEQLAGVDKVVSGYAGGDAATAHYEIVGSGKTNHAESIEVTYDPARISYGTLLKVFFSVAHDPTQLNRQGPDYGRQYRSAIFYKDDEQKRIAEAYIKQLNEAEVFKKPIVTEVTALPHFYPAEAYHQHFVKLHPTILTWFRIRCPSSTS
jgi:methionine-S-sulfoxide reductase